VFSSQLVVTRDVNTWSKYYSTRRNSVSAGNPRTLDTGIRILHSSLIDFLTDRSRAGRYFINSVKVHAELVRACTRNLLSGKRLNFRKLFNTDSDIIFQVTICRTGTCDTLQIFRANSRATDRSSEVQYHGMVIHKQNMEQRRKPFRAGMDGSPALVPLVSFPGVSSLCYSYHGTFQP